MILVYDTPHYDQPKSTVSRLQDVPCQQNPRWREEKGGERSERRQLPGYSAGTEEQPPAWNPRGR